MRIVTIANHKGGVGKTTTAYTLGYGLRAKGNKVLLVDLDPQMNLAFTADVDLSESEYRLYNVFKGKQKTVDCIYQIKDDLSDFDILVGGADMLNADAEFKNTDYLKKALKGIEYDYVVIDTPPNLGILTQNAIVASDDLIIPLNAEIFSLQGLGSIQGIIEECNPKLNISGLLLTGVNERTNLTKGMIDIFKKEAKNLNSKVFKATIRNSVVIPESQLNQTTIFDHAPRANVTQDYQNFINEYLKGVKNGTKKK